MSGRERPSRRGAGRGSEPEPGPRCQKPGMSTLSAELVEVPAAARRAEGRAFEASEDPDAALVADWLDGDERAFEQLVRRHEGRVYRLLYRMLGSREEAEDACQEAFLSLHRHGRRFRREARFSTFLYRVAANAALNRRRSLGRARARQQELAQRQAAGAHLPASPRDPEDATRGAEIQVLVQEALQTLPEELRTAVVLYDLEGQSYKEIAGILEIPEGTVKSRIHRARSGLREKLANLNVPNAVQAPEGDAT